MQTDPPRIIIFDSGVGALSVFQEIIHLEPHIHCTLAMDNAHFPYGTLSESNLIERVVSVVSSLIRRANPDLVVIACNTASTLVLDELRKQFDMPFVGVVPAIKPAAQISSSQTIGLLATPATVERSYTDNLIEDFAPNCEIIRIGSTDLVYIAEQKIRGKSIDMNALTGILAPILNSQKLDTLVLACTHFPLLRDEFAQVLPDHIQLLDSGSAIAQRVSSLLHSSENSNSLPDGSANNPINKEPHLFYLTSQDADLAAIEAYSQKLGFERAEVITL